MSEDPCFQPWRNALPLVEFWIDARPQGKERHIAGGASTLRTRAWEGEVVASCARDAWGEGGPVCGKWLGVRVQMYFKSLKKKPDVDNVIKSLYDGMRGIILGEDNQIIYEENIQLVHPEREGMWVQVLEID